MNTPQHISENSVTVPVCDNLVYRNVANSGLPHVRKRIFAKLHVEKVRIAVLDTQPMSK